GVPSGAAGIRAESQAGDVQIRGKLRPFSGNGGGPPAAEAHAREVTTACGPPHSAAGSGSSPDASVRMRRHGDRAPTPGCPRDGRRSEGGRAETGTPRSEMQTQEGQHRTLSPPPPTSKYVWHDSGSQQTPSMMFVASVAEQGTHAGTPKPGENLEDPCPRAEHGSPSSRQQPGNAAPNGSSPRSAADGGRNWRQIGAGVAGLRNLEEQGERPARWREHLVTARTYLSKPANAVVLFLGAVVVVAGAIVFMLLVGMVNLEDDAAEANWIEWCSQILNAIFTLGAIVPQPLRLRNLYRAIRLLLLSRRARLRRAGRLHDSDGISADGVVGFAAKVTELGVPGPSNATPEASAGILGDVGRSSGIDAGGECSVAAENDDGGGVTDPSQLRVWRAVKRDFPWIAIEQAADSGGAHLVGSGAEDAYAFDDQAASDVGSADGGGGRDRGRSDVDAKLADADGPEPPAVFIPLVTPKRILLVMLLLNTSCASQYVITTAMWGWPRTTRPPMMVFPLIPISFATGTLGGFLFKRDEQRSRATRRKFDKGKAPARDRVLKVSRLE
ncbi:MAG: hypothetical protein BJ554DRAFT_3996, partial [Olpidium bornovanus]